MPLKLYDELATWWPLLSPIEDYADEAAFFQRLLVKSDLSNTARLLELGCGGGNNAFYLKTAFAQVILTDISPKMLAVSKAVNPESQHFEGDMRTLRLGFQVDAVFIHDAIDYMTTPSDLRQAMETAFVHCKPGGVALFVPDHVRETFQPSTDHGGVNGTDRGMRYLEWTYDPDENDSIYTMEFAYLLREGNRSAWVEHDLHICGLFPREEWLRLLREVGFQPEIVHDEYNRDLFIARRIAIE